MATLVKDMNFDEVRERIQSSSQASSIYIGCDSALNGKGTDFICVVVIHYDSSRGAKICWQKTRIPRRMQLQERLWKEVEFASELSLRVAPLVGRRHMAVHLDLNPAEEHRSNRVTSQALAFIHALGFEAKVKPEAFAASKAADYLLR